MNTKSRFSVLVIVIIVSRCKKKAKKLALYPDLCHGKKLICIEKAKKRKSEEIRHSQNRISSAVFSSKYKKQSHFLD